MTRNKLPDDWKISKLSEISEIIMGQSPPGNSYNESKKGLPFFQGKAEFTKRYPVVRKWTTKPSKMAKKDDLLMSVRAPVGSLNIANIDCCIGRGLAAIRVKKEMDKDYIYYYLLSIENKIENLGTGSTFKAINRKQLANILIPCPPLQTQKRIVSFLEKTDQLRALRQEADELTDYFLQNLFIDMFGDPMKNPKKWLIVKAEDLFDMKLGKMLSAKNYTGKNLRPYLRNVNVQWNKLDLSDVKQMDFNDEEFKRYELKKGDILVCEGGEVGRTTIYNGEIPNCCYQNALHRLRIKKTNITREYFTHFMMIAVKYGMIQKDTIQVTIAHFTADKFKKLKIMLPPIELQNKFAKIVQQIEEMKQKQSVSKEKIEEIASAITQKAFAGEIA